MKGLIIFKGKYGATAQYASWLGEKLKLPVHTAGDNFDLDPTAGDYVIIGSSVYIGKLQIAAWLKNNLSTLLEKKIFLFVVSGTAAGEKEKLESYIRDIPPVLKNNCSVFFLPGRLNIKALSWKDRFLLKMGARLAKDPAIKKAMLTDNDHVNKENLLPIISAVKQYCSSAEQIVTVS